MCLPTVHLEGIEKKSHFEGTILNKVSDCYPGFNPDWSKPWSKDLCKRIKQTEFKHVYVVLVRGVQTYLAHIPIYNFSKVGDNCKTLAKEVDKELMRNGQPPVNFFQKKAS